ncbi:ABC transporter ATP-binding protein [Marinibactrum halimedae]|uniref:ABC transporter n=1 Tax=Marinibactrum halimedae TaxID=1444977 RepID=A0AA37T3C3_9GAMM|nr:ABC transporter ATP-binding protein [Marinibactrum halimedae]MCD9457965.1 ABC transporter ATP-binding protein [Marinibactrum halimedae]GLS26204.1 ABC transporter [Marinibactrum halimedae]
MASVHSDLPLHLMEASELSLGHDDTLIIERLSVRLQPGSISAIVGPNGCGKSTLLKGLSRILTPKAGQVLLDGKDVKQLPSREVAKHIGLMPQDNQAPDGITVRELVEFGRHPHQGLFRQWTKEDESIVNMAIASADLTDIQDRKLETLSGGQRQRAWIAMTVAQDTSILLLDEPTSALDLGHELEVLELIKRLNEQGKTIVMVIHDINMACRFADHLIAMVGGKIVAEGAPEKVIDKSLIRDLYKVDCDIVSQPGYSYPMIIPKTLCE